MMSDADECSAKPQLPFLLATRSTLASELQVNFAGATWWHTGSHFLIFPAIRPAIDVKAK